MEFVYVVERARLFDLSFPHGLISAATCREQVQAYLTRIRDHGFFLERRKAEQDSSFKQIIPYMAIKKDDQVMLLERSDKQGEARLHGKRSIGIGGHINPVDVDAADILLEGLRREVQEELHVDGSLDYRVAGFLNDDSSDVGSVHFGLVVVADASNAQVSIRETDMMDGRFVARSELVDLHAAEPDRFETWSALLVERLDEVLSSEISLSRALAASS